MALSHFLKWAQNLETEMLTCNKWKEYILDG